MEFLGLPLEAGITIRRPSFLPMLLTRAASHHLEALALRQKLCLENRDNLQGELSGCVFME